MDTNESSIQKAYYRDNAANYDNMHAHAGDEHYFALAFMLGAVDFLAAESIVDIGSGTGRVLEFIKNKRPDVHAVGVEPIPELRQIAYGKGITEDCLIDGDATDLPFATNSFDMACEFGVLHHIKRPELAIKEMLRVARKAVFISDSNNFGHGSATARFLKQGLNAVGLWKVADFIKTGGRGYTMSRGDGLAYSYSVFTSYKQISRECRSVHILNTKDGGISLYRTASHVALLGLLLDK